MKITFERLCEIFRVRDDRQLRVNLFGKVSIIDQNTVKVTNKALAKLFKELENDTIISLSEAAAIYKEAEPYIQYCANAGYIDFFKLAPGKKGSKMLFQKSKLDEFFSTNIKWIKKERSMSEKRELELLIIQGCLYNYETWKDILTDFFVNMMSSEEIAQKHKITPQTVRMKIRFGINTLSKNFIQMMQNQNDLSNYKNRVNILESEIHMYKSSLHNGLTKESLPVPIELLSKPIESFQDEMSVRLFKILTGDMECKNLNDVIQFTETKASRYRNIGLKTINELKDFLSKYKLKLKKG